MAFVSRFLQKFPAVRTVEGRREAVLGEVRARVVTRGAGGWRWSGGAERRVARPPEWPGKGRNGGLTATGSHHPAKPDRFGPRRVGRSFFAFSGESRRMKGQWLVSGQWAVAVARRPGAFQGAGGQGGGRQWPGKTCGARPCHGSAGAGFLVRMYICTRVAGRQWPGARGQWPGSGIRGDRSQRNLCAYIYV